MILSWFPAEFVIVPIAAKSITQIVHICYRSCYWTLLMLPVFLEHNSSAIWTLKPRHAVKGRSNHRDHGSVTCGKFRKPSKTQRLHISPSTADSFDLANGDYWWGQFFLYLLSHHTREPYKSTKFNCIVVCLRETRSNCRTSWQEWWSVTVLYFYLMCVCKTFTPTINSA